MQKSRKCAWKTCRNCISVLKHCARVCVCAQSIFLDHATLVSHIICVEHMHSSRVEYWICCEWFRWSWPTLWQMEHLGGKRIAEWFGCYNLYVTLFDWTTFFERVNWRLALPSENKWDIQWGFVVQRLHHLPRQQETLGSKPGEFSTFFTCQKAQ